MNSQRVAAAVAVFACLWAIVAPAQRLPTTPVPEHYAIHLEPDFNTDTFAGRVTIDVRLSEATQVVTLNAAEIAIQQATISAGGNTQTADAVLDAKRETAALTVPHVLPAGKATIAIRYRGQLNDKLR